MKIYNDKVTEMTSPISISSRNTHEMTYAHNGMLILSTAEKTNESWNVLGFF